MGGGRAPCCDKSKVKKGPWSPAEDLRLIAFIQKNGHGNWRSLPKQAGLLRCGKSCRLRWINYLRPDVKRGKFTPEEEEAIIKLHGSLGNKWSKIASHFPGRTDNEIKNVWNTHLKKKLLKNKGTTIMSSLSPSSSSNSFTSYEDQNIDKELGDHVEKQDPSTIISNDCGPINNESKEATSSSSSISSNFSNCDQIDVTRPIDELNPLFNFGGLGEFHHMIEIPWESDVDIWDMLDNLDSLASGECQQQQFEGSQSSNFGEVDDKEVECRKWMKYLENELGLEGSPTVDEEQESPQKKAAEQLVTEIDMEMGDFPTWPSPSNFSM